MVVGGGAGSGDDAGRAAADFDADFDEAGRAAAADFDGAGRGVFGSFSVNDLNMGCPIVTR
jgi:hypothetical protein